VAEIEVIMGSRNIAKSEIRLIFLRSIDEINFQNPKTKGLKGGVFIVFLSRGSGSADSEIEHT
jgi:hypothetical protein